MLETQDLTVRFGGHVAVNAVSCAFAPGTLTAIVGPNGAGKTTYFNLISGQIKATAGTVTPSIDEPPVTEAGGALPATGTTSSLDGPSPDAVGLLSPAQTGFPHALWGLGLTDEAAAALTRADPVGLPALQALLNTVLLAEALPPADMTLPMPPKIRGWGRHSRSEQSRGNSAYLI